MEQPNNYPASSLENQLLSILTSSSCNRHCPECSDTNKGLTPLGMLANGNYHCSNCGYIGITRLEDG